MDTYDDLPDEEVRDAARAARRCAIAIQALTSLIRRTAANLREHPDYPPSAWTGIFESGAHATELLAQRCQALNVTAKPPLFAVEVLEYGQQLVAEIIAASGGGLYAARALQVDREATAKQWLAVCEKLVTRKLIDAEPDFTAKVHRRIVSEAVAAARTRERDPTNHDYAVTLQQMASMVSQSKRTIRRLYDDGKLPMPIELGGKGRANRWSWLACRDVLIKEYGRALPLRFPADRVACK